VARDTAAASQERLADGAIAMLPGGVESEQDLANQDERLAKNTTIPLKNKGGL
jgi:hypothetical protein